LIVPESGPGDLQTICSDPPPARVQAQHPGAGATLCLWPPAGPPRLASIPASRGGL